jgi:hypothetical protein
MNKTATKGMSGCLLKHPKEFMEPIMVLQFPEIRPLLPFLTEAEAEAEAEARGLSGKDKQE